MLPALAITPGEPTGIGPDLVVQLAQQDWPYQLIAFADPDLLLSRAKQLGLPLQLEAWQPNEPRTAKNALLIAPFKMPKACEPGKPDPEFAAYQLEALDQAIHSAMTQQVDALVTGPMQKSVINAAGIPFSGHTEYLAERTQSQQPVMLMHSPSLRVALFTTHLPLHQVPEQLSQGRLKSTLEILNAAMKNQFGIEKPRISICGLNPHAGENGYLGTEEQDIIQPVINELRNEGFDLTDPLPADTAFTPPKLAETDVVLTMYHDQGLPVIKHAAFHQIVNVTLGLPIIRTSVDHGTALNLAGTGKANADSFSAAIHLAAKLSSPSGKV